MSCSSWLFGLSGLRTRTRRMTTTIIRPTYSFRSHSTTTTTPSSFVSNNATLDKLKGIVSGVRSHTPLKAKRLPEQTMKAAVFPIDAHRDTIISHVRSNRVTILHGEPGCGKSSRLPAMLYEGWNGAAKMFVSQPRRIAARALTERMRAVDANGHVYGYRLGQQQRLEDHSTRIWYCTSGYLVQLLSHHSAALRNHTHLVIDEVHERSVDSDLLCFIARKLVAEHPNLRLVIMSATINTSLYATYFNVASDQTLFVGAKRFPLQTYFADDLRRAPMYIDRNRTELLRLCDRGTTSFPSRAAPLQYSIATWLIGQLSRSQSHIEGSAALVFVSGMADIHALNTSLQRLQDDLDIIHIHSQIPFDQQMQAFVPSPVGRFKVVIATNAAESSLTLPDVDNVICLGTHKQTQRADDDGDQSQLVNSWIPQSSAIQRAGRTARTRPGTVYRLYPRSLYDALPTHEAPEIQRSPLDALILRLKTISTSSSSSSSTHTPITPIISSLLEPPSDASVSAAFSSLHRLGMLSAASDEGIMTPAGEIASKLGVDVRIARLLCIANALDVLPAAIAVAAMQQLPSSVFRSASPLVHSPSEIASITSRSLGLAHECDDGNLSSPMMMLALYKRWNELPRSERIAFAADHAIASSRMRQMDQFCANLRTRVSQCFPPATNAAAAAAENEADHLLMVRLMQLWTFPDQVIRLKRAHNVNLGWLNSIPIRPPNILKDHHLQHLCGGNNGSARVDSRTVIRASTPHILADNEALSDIADVVLIVNEDKHNRDVRVRVRITTADSGDHDDDSVWASVASAFQRLGIELQWIRSEDEEDNATAGDRSYFVTGTSVKQPLNKKETASIWRHFSDVDNLRLSSAILIRAHDKGCDLIGSRVSESDLQHFFAADDLTIQERDCSDRIVFDDDDDQGLFEDDRASLAQKIISGIASTSRGAAILQISNDDNAPEAHVRLDLDRSNWILCSEYSRSGSSAQIMLSDQTLLEQALFAKSDVSEPVFAVASKVMYCGSSQQNARVEGVSVLPSGQEWLDTAFQCISEKPARKGPLEADIEQIRQRLRHACISLEKDERLSEDIRALFEKVEGLVQEKRQRNTTMNIQLPKIRTVEEIRLEKEEKERRKKELEIAKKNRNKKNRNKGVSSLLTSIDINDQRLMEMCRKQPKKFQCVSCSHSTKRWVQCVKHMNQCESMQATLRTNIEAEERSTASNAASAAAEEAVAESGKKSKKKRSGNQSWIRRKRQKAQDCRKAKQAAQAVAAAAKSVRIKSINDGNNMKQHA